MKIKFNNTTLNDASNFIINKILNNRKGYVCTPNPEMLLETKKNPEFIEVLNNSLLNIPDGIGILWAATHIHNESSKLKAIITLPLIAIYPKIFKKILKERVTGTDLVQKLCQDIKNKDIKVFLLGAAPGIAKETAKILESKYENLKITGTYAGTPRIEDSDNIVNLINDSEADLLFVAYGAPKQEMWIASNLQYMKTVKIAVGIGGAFDFIVGKRKRAPKWMRKLGLEWLFRLIQEPSRIKRIYNATIKFPIEVLKTLK